MWSLSLNQCLSYCRLQLQLYPRLHHYHHHYINDSNNKNHHHFQVVFEKVLDDLGCKSMAGNPWLMEASILILLLLGLAPIPRQGSSRIGCQQALADKIAKIVLQKFSEVSQKRRTSIFIIYDMVVHPSVRRSIAVCLF